MHAEGEQNAWYALTVGSHQVFLRITIAAHGSSQIDASTDYEGVFTRKELADIHRQNHQLWLEIIAWFEAHAPENGVTEQQEKWFSNARREIDKTYTTSGL